MTADDQTGVLGMGSSSLKPYLTATELARILNVSTRTLRRYEAAGIGPAPFNLLDGGRTLYSAEEVHQWLEEEQARAAEKHSAARAEFMERQRARLLRDRPASPRKTSSMEATGRKFSPGRETVRHPDEVAAGWFE